MGLGKYIKIAAVNRWNLLALAGGCGFALVSGFGGIFLPLVAAAELSYLAFVGTHPKFQHFVDSQAARLTHDQSSQTSQQMLARITGSLPRESLQRFEALRTQCLELRQIAAELKHPGGSAVTAPFDEFQLSGLDRLLWIYIRLLYTQFALSRFFQKTSGDAIQHDIAALEDKLAKLPPADADPQRQRIRKALADNLETSRARLTNLSKAKDNYTLVKLEIDRLENKIRSLSEMAVNRQEPDFISGQVDQVASSMVETERTMNELQFVTGLDAPEDAAPELLREKVTQ